MRQSARGATKKGEKLVREVKGEKRVDVMIYPLIANGVEGAVVRVDDVTERVRIEEMMIQTEKMLSVGGIAAGVAHEINNPLAGILQGGAEHLPPCLTRAGAERRGGRGVRHRIATVTGYLEKREILQLLQGIQESGERAAKIVSDMLQFSRPSELARRLHRSPAARQDGGARGHRLRPQEALRLPQHRDRPRVRPALGAGCLHRHANRAGVLNLLKNAAQAMHEGRGQRRRTSRAITLRIRKDGVWARIEVEDNGPGMDEETRSRVFEPFFTTKGPGSGTGLGLSVSYFIVAELHKGELQSSRPRAEGTKFIVRIPLAGSDE